MKIKLEELYKIYLKHPLISKDSRNVPKGCIYFSLSGEKFDGNKFAEDAIEKGAAYAVIDNIDYQSDERFLLVDDCLKSLQDLARMHRSKLEIPIIGITGSNGKTTTKELISTVLAQKYNTFSTIGNYNNHIGVPLSILQIGKQHEIAVIEMGANHQGEIEFLCSISDPDHGMITNIGKAHLEGFGGIEGVKKGKSELYRHLEKKDALVFINGDDETLLSLSHSKRQKKYGTQANCDCRAVLQQSHPFLKGSWTDGKHAGTIDAQIYGAYNFYNMLAAICIGNHFGVEVSKIDDAVNSYQSTNNRSEIKSFDDHKVYLDAYNANPSSTKAAIDNFNAMEVNPADKILVLGDMFELGEESISEHQKMISYALSKDFSKILFVGKNYSKAYTENEKSTCVDSTEDASKWYHTLNKKAKHILIKGSRGMALEKLLV